MHWTWIKHILPYLPSLTNLSRCSKPRCCLSVHECTWWGSTGAKNMFPYLDGFEMVSCPFETWRFFYSKSDWNVPLWIQKDREASNLTLLLFSTRVLENCFYLRMVFFRSLCDCQLEILEFLVIYIDVNDWWTNARSLENLNCSLVDLLLKRGERVKSAGFLILCLSCRFVWNSLFNLFSSKRLNSTLSRAHDISGPYWHIQQRQQKTGKDRKDINKSVTFARSCRLYFSVFDFKL